MNPLGAAYSAITGDDPLMALLPGEVHTIWAPLGVVPRLILSYSTGRIDEISRGGTLTADLFFDGHRLEAANEIKLKIVEILEKHVFCTSETGETTRFYYESDDIVTEDEPDKGHVSIIFDLRYARKLVV